MDQAQAPEHSMALGSSPLEAKRSPSGRDQDQLPAQGHSPAFSELGTELLFLTLQASDQNRESTCSNADALSPWGHSLDPDTCPLYCFPIQVPLAPQPPNPSVILRYFKNLCTRLAQ